MTLFVAGDSSRRNAGEEEGECARDDGIAAVVVAAAIGGGGQPVEEERRFSADAFGVPRAEPMLPRAAAGSRLRLRREATEKRQQGRRRIKSALLSSLLSEEEMKEREGSGLCRLPPPCFSLFFFLCPSSSE